MAQIEIRNVSKSFVTDGKELEVLKNVNINIEKGEIFGIIGMSGAGKSTLVRCINFLEKPTKGDIIVENDNLKDLSEEELRFKRTNIAMIFQSFNLLMQKKVIDNVMFPMRIRHINKKLCREKAHELLRLVDLQDKENAYPAQLSGGQRQRVAIARALATDPHILLCDEATSALDPKTTKSILELLKNINEKLGITIVIITHQMEVIRAICNRVAIIEEGVVAETGTVEDIFARPTSQAGKKLILNSFREEKGLLKESIKGGVIVRIVFTSNSSYEPVIANMVLKTGCPVNILGADTKNVGGVAKGEMILSLPEEHALEMKEYLAERGLSVEEIDYEDGGEADA